MRREFRPPASQDAAVDKLRLTKIGVVLSLSKRDASAVHVK